MIVDLDRRGLVRLLALVERERHRAHSAGRPWPPELLDVEQNLAASLRVANVGQPVASQPDAPRCWVSVTAVATATGLPPRTVRRRVMRLATSGTPGVVRSSGGWLVSPETAKEIHRVTRSRRTDDAAQRSRPRQA